MSTNLPKEIDMNILENLSPEQKDAATSSVVCSVVSAGAGTGKTTTLTARLAHLLVNESIPANNVMAVTFTKKAAMEITERVAHHVGDRAKGLRIGTFHSLSNRILRRNAAMCGLVDSSYGIIDEDDQRDLLRIAAAAPAAYGAFERAPDMTDEQAKAASKEWLEGLSGFADQARRQISLWKSWGLTADMISDRERPDLDEFTEKLAACYVAYQYELESRNLCDFGDLILKVVVLFDRHPDILRQEAARVRHILVDEAQDANQVQIRFVRHLASVHGRMTVVGDEDQNIYGFQGGYAGAMRDMAGPTAKAYALTLNRRCTKEILKPANQIVDYNNRRSPKVLNSERSGAPVRVTGHPTDASEAAWIAARIKELVEGGANPSEIAILFRSSFLMQPFEEALARKGVAAAMTTGTSMLEREEIKDVLAMVRLAVNPRDDLAFVRVANKPSRNLGTSACEGIINIARHQDVELHEACRIACEEGNGVALNKTAKAGAVRLARALHLLSEDGRWGRPVFDIISTGLTELDYDKYVAKHENADNRRLNIEALHRLSETYEEASLFLQDMSLITDGEPVAGDLAKVRLLTIHSSKGLEFDHVFCPGFDYGVMPNPRAVDEGGQGKPGDVWFGPAGGGLEEERRLAHVAFTRARKTLDVSFPWRRGRMKKKQSKLAGPSFFIEECDLRYEDMESVSTAELGKVRDANELQGRLGFDRD
jgi:DNA helicase-2/ATP-dependent DNA helicase PcrA